MMRNFDERAGLVALAILLMAAACGDDGRDRPDAAAGTPDAGSGSDAAALADAAPMPDAVPLVGLEGARIAPHGPVEIPIDQVLVTYIRPHVGSDPAGFFVQTGNTGPALFVAVDPATLPQVPVIGDMVRFTVTRMTIDAGRRMATALRDFQIVLRGYDVGALAQDITERADLVAALDDYDSELVTARVTLRRDFLSAGTGHVAAEVDMGTLAGSGALRLRIPLALQERVALMPGCSLEVGPTPLWRLSTMALVSAWTRGELRSVSCPAPRVIRAVAASAGEVMVEFERELDPSTVAQPRFLIAESLSVTSTRVEGRRVFLTTSPQTGGKSYTVTVAANVADTFGRGVDEAANKASFSGFVPRASVRINELRANFPRACDLVELRVIQGGSLQGFQVMEHDHVVLTFPAFTVARNDLIVVHFNNSAECNPGGGTGETTAVNEQPRATFPSNFDTAFDWYPTGKADGMLSTDNVLTVVDPLGRIVDAVLLTDGLTGSVSPASVMAAARVADAGEWQAVGGGVPLRGFMGDDFHQHAVLGLDGEGSIVRRDDGDTNTRTDWAGNTVSSFGSLNEGQSPL